MVFEFCKQRIIDAFIHLSAVNFDDFNLKIFQTDWRNMVISLLELDIVTDLKIMKFLNDRLIEKIYNLYALLPFTVHIKTKVKFFYFLIKFLN